MKFINPNYVLKDENNFFNIRKNTSANLLEKINEIIQPVTDIGFEIVEVAIKNARSFPNELAKTVKQNLVIVLKKGEHEIDLSMYIPKLIDNNYFMINGRKKLPLFQLFDIPIITRKDKIKIRLNPTIINIAEDKKDSTIKITILKRKIPLALLLYAYYGVDKVIVDFKLDEIDLENFDRKQSLYNGLLYDLKLYHDDLLVSDQTQDDFIKEVGRYYSKSNYVIEGNKVLYAIDLLLKIDIFSRPYFKSNILEEVVELIKGKTYDDMDFSNKRIRCLEYVILSSLCKIIFEFCLLNANQKQPKYNINSSNIITACNVSDIVQFDFSINPIEELTLLSRTSLTGPGGFKKDNVPHNLRDISESMYGKLCTVDTPDRENCGILQNLAINCELDENLKFKADSQNIIPISISVSMVPFLEHDDPTRLQMASSQSRQAIMLKEVDSPMVQSGCEGLYSEYTQFVKIAREDGEIVFKNEKYIIIKYDENDSDIFDIEPRKIFVENVDIYKIYYDVGDTVNKGDIIFESNFCNDGKITTGRNLLTAVMPFYGRNYEDAIVISESCAKKYTSKHYIDLSFKIPDNSTLLSLDSNEYKPLPKVGDIIQSGVPYAIIKKFPEIGNIEGDIIFYDEKVFKEELKNITITDIEVYVNSYHNDLPEYRKWVIDMIEEQKERYKNYQYVLKKHKTLEDATEYIKDNMLNRFEKNGEYKIKGESIKGIWIKMFGVYEKPLSVGDKLANRHGNKGVISTIIADDKMIRLPDGRIVDIIINPCGFLSRMNFGQLFELHITNSLYDFRNEVLRRIEDNIPQEEIKLYIMMYVKLFDNTKTGWLFKQYEDQMPEKITEDYINNFYIIQPPFESVNRKMMLDILTYTNTSFRDTIYEALKGINISNQIACGFIYFNKLVHMAGSKISFRGIGSYSKKTMQPLGGRKNFGGQRAGEMEIACLIAQDGTNNLQEFLTIKSDCIELKNDYIQNEFGLKTRRLNPNMKIDIKPESVKILESFLKIINIDM